MKIYSVHLFKCLAQVVFVLQCACAFGQASNPSATNDLNRLENSIKQKQSLGRARFELDSIYHHAVNTGDDILQARSLNYLIMVKDQLTEDSLYFRNSAIIDTLLRSAKTSAKLKAMLYVMQARRISGFDQLKHKNNSAAYRLKNVMKDYASLTLVQRNELSNKYLDTAFTLSPFSKVEAGQLLWLSSSPSGLLFEAGFEDIIFSEKVGLAFRNAGINVSQQWVIDMLTMPVKAFNLKMDSLASAAKAGGKTTALSIYHDWIAFHKNNEETRAFIESLTRKFIYLPMEYDAAVTAAYIDYLQTAITSTYPAVKAHAIYQLCLLWNREGNKYKSFSKYSYYDYSTNFNESYRGLPAKAFALYEQNKELIAKYPAFKRILDIMAGQINAKAIRVELSDTHLPNEALPLRATYKNIDTLHYRVIKINATETKGKNRVKSTDELLKKAIVIQGAFRLPLPADHNVHATHLKFDGLPAGRYRLLFSDKPIDSTDSLNSIYFSVSGVVAINAEERVFVLDRKTGYPLTGAQVKAYDGRKQVKGVSSQVPVGGYVTVRKDEADSLSITYKGDTLAYNINTTKNEISEDVYSKSDFEDLDDFYDDKVRMQLFTDRAIYRPGQTVQYKIIFLTKHPKTGETILFNKQHLGGGIFKTRLKKWLADDNDLVMLRDVFGKKIDSARLTINEFGSFAGSFVLPKTAATGNWYIDAQPDNDGPNNGSFAVEEYKRPSIELSAVKQTKMLRPGQPFFIKLKLRSFSGSDLNNVPVTYTVRRTGNVPANGKAIEVRRYISDTLLHATGYTDAKGELAVSITDAEVAKAKLIDSLFWSYNYLLDAKATDLTGESATIQENVNVSSRPVNINLTINNTIDRQRLPVLNIRASNVFEGDINRQINLKVYKTGKSAVNTTLLTKEVDQWYYAENDWKKWFPESDETGPAVQRSLVLDTMINTAVSAKMILNKKLFVPGYYELEANTVEGQFTLGKIKKNFSVFDSETGEWVGDKLDYFPSDFANADRRLTWYTSGKTDNFTIYHSVYASKNNKIVNHYYTTAEQPGVRQWNFKVPADAVGQVLINKISVKNNKIYTTEKRVYVNAHKKAETEIIVERYKKVMVPGAEERFTVSVKTKDDNIAAEFMTTLYDASLDKLKAHRWVLPYTNVQQAFLRSEWEQSIADAISAEFASPEMTRADLSDRMSMEENKVFYSTEARLSGLDYAAGGLQEVVVVGYGTVARSALSGAVGSVNSINIRGNSVMDYRQPLIVLDGVAITEDMLKNLDPGTITQALVLKGADASAVYGSRAAEGVFVISTKGPIVFPEQPTPEVKIRKNFNETAFFFPQIHADKDGLYTFSFTMPETATEWNWKMLAHTRDARFAYLEKKLQTQLNLMVQPNMPRLLYQGDKIKLQSRISNLDSLRIQGKASIKIEDAVTGNDITTQLTAGKDIAFSIDKKSSGSVAFMLSIPSDQTNPLKIVITATGGGVADAEEHFIPVLSSKVFIRQSVPVRFDDKATITINKPKLPANAVSYGLGIYINQQPQAALIYALPWLATYSFDCAEQTFNKLRAQATTLKLMQSDTSVQSAFKRAKTFMEKEQPVTDALPNEMAEQTMPWLTLTNNTASQQKQLFRLLDTLATKASIEKHLRRLYTLQKPDGGLSWFEGGESNTYISAYVLAGFGQLKQMNWAATNNIFFLQQAFMAKLIKYAQNRLADSINYSDRSEVLYALSYWLREQPLTPQQLISANSILQKEWSKVSDMTLEKQAQLIINTIRYLPAGHLLRVKADAQLENIRQMAINDDVNGLRWKAIADAESMNTSAEETMSLLAEAYELSSKYPDVQTGIIKWLLTAKQQEHWQTTKATAAAINMLQKEKGSNIAGSKAFSVDIAGKSLNVSDGLLGGRPADFLPAKETPSDITLKQNSTNATGAVTWYYFANAEGLDTLGKTVKINKQFFVYDANRSNPRALINGEVLKAGQSLQVKLTVDAAVNLQYVHINDPRAALFEPGQNSSGYRYNKGTGYYQSIRDTGVELFTEAIPRGITEFTYDVVVAHSGEFSSGPATLQCMYQPALAAYSSTQSFKSE